MLPPITVLRKIILVLLVLTLAACSLTSQESEPPTLVDKPPLMPLHLPIVFPTAASLPIGMPPLAPMSAPDGLMVKELDAGAVPAPARMLPALLPPNDQPYLDTFYENYGVNPMIDTEDDHLSTFALDVDTGSYTIARRYVMDGNLPDKDSVRVEEFVNYFKQGYNIPTEGQTFSIHIDGSPSPFSENDKYQILRIGIQGYAVEPGERKDVALTFVIDVSGSMQMENRLELVKKALALLVSELRPSDSVGIVTYGTKARVVLEPTSGREKETIMDVIHSLYPEGSTNAAEGLRLGYEMAEESFNWEGLNRVILCSDGVANVGDTSAVAIWDSIEENAERGITLTTVGFGMGNYNDVLMEQLADKGDGFYAYVDNFREAERIFVTNLTSTLQVIAKNARVQIDFNPEMVTRYRLLGFENRAVADEDFRNDKIDAGEIGAGHSITALYEIKLVPEARGQIAMVALRWLDPQTERPDEVSRDLYSNQMADSFSEADPHLQWDVVVAEYAEIMRESYWAQESSLSAVLDEARRISEILPGEQDVIEFVDMVRLTERLSKVN
jgi:Ca-activated chloride channel family protein